MANEQHMAILLQGLMVWNEWRTKHPEILPDLSNGRFTAHAVEGTMLSNAKLSGVRLSSVNLSHASLQKIDLSGASLFGADFRSAHLQEANLSGANLSRAILENANLSGAFLMNTNFTGADLSRADLSGARLSKANLSGANLRGANLSKAGLYGTLFNGANMNNAFLTNAQVGWATFANVDLQQVIGLESVHHVGPSSIGLDTIIRSQGNISASFLVGAGLHQTFIQLLQAQARNTAETLTCSVGYSLVDQPLAEQLLRDLRALDIPCWAVPHYHDNDDRPPGTIRYNDVTSFIHRYDRLVQIFSSDTLRVDDDLEQADDIYEEVQTALRQEDERQQQVLFPVRVDDAILTTDTPWAVELRQNRPILDFTQWQDEDAYQRVFAHLLRMLLGEERASDEAV